MKLKDIVSHCLEYAKKPGNGIYDQKYYWVLNGLTYQIDKVETYCSSASWNDGYQYYYSPVKDSYTNILHLSRYRNFDKQSYTNDKNNELTVNLDNEITIFDNFIIVHKTSSSTNYDVKLFHTHDYWIDANTRCHTQYYVLGLMSQSGTMGCLMNNLRTVFKDLIDPPVLSKPAQPTLDEKVDDLINELMKDNKVKAIKQLKRMLNERL